MMTNFSVKTIRLTMGLSQHAFSKLIHATQGTVAKIESNSISVEKHEVAIQNLFNEWRENKIAALNEEIEFLRRL